MRLELLQIFFVSALNWYLLHTVTGLPIALPPDIDTIRYNKTLFSSKYMRYNISNSSNSSDYITHCSVRAVEQGVFNTVQVLLDGAKLIDYQFSVSGYDINPLTVNNKWSFRPEVWSRVASSHGQTILNLAFNYGVLSLWTLRFGTAELEVELQDEPAGCLGQLQEDEKLLVLLNLVIRDLDSEGRVRVFQGQSSVCHQWILDIRGTAKFVDRCCYESDDTLFIDCVTDVPNKWLHMLDVLLGLLTVCVFIFGPLLLPDWVYTAALDTQDYFVKLKEPLFKKLVVCRGSTVAGIKYTHLLDLRNRQDFLRARRIITELPSDKVIPIKISQFDLKVNYKKLMTEQVVNVGMVESLSRAVFLCKIQETDAFHDCCNAKILGCLSTEKGCCRSHASSWINMCNVLGRMLLVLCLPIPFYIRLVVYYLCESPEIEARMRAADDLVLGMYYNYRVLQYLTPTHPLYLCVYVIFFSAGMVIAYYSGIEKKTRFQQAIADAFADLNNLSMLDAVSMLVQNCLWPFTKYGVFGMFVGILIWPIIFPISLVLCCIYCLPIVFVTCRIVRHVSINSHETEHKREKLKPSPSSFRAKHVMERLQSVRGRRRVQEHWHSWRHLHVWRVTKQVVLSASAIATLCSVMVMIAEVIGFLAEIMCFTMMGIIVNASAVLKYGSLLFFVVWYSYDIYNNVTKQYLKLNKAIFAEIKFRLGNEIDQYTQLPSSIQENRGFKADEASDQAEYEITDDISSKSVYQWTINDLILFIDKEDCPRIPRKLFDQICQIRAAGSPGPIYLSLIAATKRFLLIVLFLVFAFVVVLSFGESYKISQTNQMMATVAGGFLPYLFRKAFKPDKVKVETQLLSFRSKLEEIIKNYYQGWPMYDLVFDVEEEKPESDDSSSESVDSKHSKKEQKKRGEKGTKEKDNEAKNGPKDKKDSKSDWLALVTSTKNVSTLAIRKAVEEMEPELLGAEGQEVDIVVMVTERDHDWTYELSSTSDFKEFEMNLTDEVNGNIPMITINGVAPGLFNKPGEPGKLHPYHKTSTPASTHYNSLKDLTIV